MTFFVLASVLAFALVPGGQANPAGVRVKNAEDCVASCQSMWGWPGYPFMNDPWGQVVSISTVDTETGAGATGTGAVGGVEAAPTTDSASTTAYTSIIPAPSLAPSSSSSTPTSESSSSKSSSPTSAPSSTHKPPSLKLSTPAPAPPQTSSAPPPPPPPPSSSSHKASPSPSPSQSPPPAPANVPASGGGSSSSGGTSQSDIQAYLSGHNDARAQHGAAPLTYSQDLAAKAQQWANGCEFTHSGGTLGPFGENLAAGTGDGYGIPQAIGSWTGEASQYNPGNPQASHFTQVVWKATTQVGCAVQDCNGIFPGSDQKAHYYVCEYSPPGNVLDEFDTNVQA